MDNLKRPAGIPELWVNYDGTKIYKEDARFGLVPLKPKLTDKGYLKVTQLLNGKKYMRFVHRLVALAWIGPAPQGKPMIRHLNGTRADNRACNLKWGTMKENAQDSVRHGTCKSGDNGRKANLRKLHEGSLGRKYDLATCRKAFDLRQQGKTHGTIIRELGLPAISSCYSIIKRAQTAYALGLFNDTEGGQRCG